MRCSSAREWAAGTADAKAAAADFKAASADSAAVTAVTAAAAAANEEATAAGYGGGGKGYGGGYQECDGGGRGMALRRLRMRRCGLGSEACRGPRCGGGQADSEAAAAGTPRRLLCMRVLAADVACAIAHVQRLPRMRQRLPRMVWRWPRML